MPDTATNLLFDAELDPAFAKPGRKRAIAAAAEEAASRKLNPLRDAATIKDNAVALGVATEDQALRVATQPTGFEQLGAAMSQNTDARLFRGVRDLLTGARGEFDDEVEKGYTIPKEAAVGVNEADLQERREARSKAELEHIIGKQAERNEYAATLFRDGTTKGVALSFLAEGLSVTNWLTGFASARLQAANTVAQASRSVRVAQGVKYNLAQGTAIEGGLQLLEQRFDPANLGLAATVDIAFGAGFNWNAIPAAKAQQVVTEAVQRESDLLNRAAANLGPTADKAAVEAEYVRLRTEELREPVVGGLAPTGANRKLMEHPDEIEAADTATVQADRGWESVPTEVEAPKKFATLADVEEQWGRVAVPRYEKADVLQGTVVKAAMRDSEYGDIIQKVTGGEFKNYKELTDLPKGVHVTKAAAAEPQLQPAIKALRELANEYLGPDTRIIFGKNVWKETENGVISTMGNTHVIGVRVDAAPGTTRINHATMHELGHAIVHQKLKDAPPGLLARINEDYLAFVNRAAEGDPAAVTDRFAITNAAATKEQLKTTAYNVSRDEWMAEQYVKHVQKRLVDGDFGQLSKGVIASVLDAIRSVVDMFLKAKVRKLAEPTASMDEFFRGVLNRSLSNEKALLREAAAEVPTTAAAEAADITSNPVAVKYGLTNLPQGTTAEKAQAKALVNLYTKADEWAIKHPKDAEWDKRAQNLIDNSVFSAASTGLHLLKSNNPVARMIASELLEDASGVAAKRQSTAAISKYLHERLFMGNSINDVQNAYAIWRKNNGGTLKDDFLGGEYRARFDKLVASEIESRRRTGAALSQDENVKAAADSLESAYERMRKAQISNKTLGWAAMPETSVGYMPHRISARKFQAATNEQRRVIHDALSEQFVNIEGWDAKFADELAAKYLQRVHARANGGHDSPIGGNSSGSAEIVEDALLTMGMSRDEVRANMQRFNRGAATWTKKRIDLDLNRDYSGFKLLDIFETDQLALLRSQAGRASGEVALARHGVYGRPGLQTIREAMTYGADGGRTTPAELQAFDQVSAEFINAPFGDAGPKWLERARVLNSVVRLGGIVYNQAAEFINGVTHVGVARTLSAVAAIPRLRGEIKALAAGTKVENPLLTSIEKLGGAEFGTDAYKIIMPFDSPDHAYPTYGHDTVGVADKLLRGASYAQAKLSLWRTMHSVQQRGMAEQIVAKIARYVRDGKEDIALDQFGISPAVREALKKDLDKVAKWDGDSLAEFDVTKMTDLAMQDELIQSVHRGVSQIIQGTFIGETGKWAHDGYLKMLTQFRTFSLTSMEKQWARQRNSRGTGAALGIMLGSMSVAAPVYIARVYASSIGRPDQEAYLERRLTPAMIARQTLNYIAMSGLAGDFIDMGASMVPDEYGVAMTGGRAGTDTTFVGNLVAPSLSLVDDVWKAAQNLDDPEKIARVLPGSRLPYLLPAVNALGD